MIHRHAVLTVAALILLVSGVAVPAQAQTTASPHALPWIRVAGKHFLDSDGQQVLLRGFLTTTETSAGRPMTYTADDYARMRALGANVQSLRLNLAAVSGLSGAQAQTEYIQKLDSMVNLAGGALTWNPLASTLDFRWQPGTFRSGEALSVAIMGE
jgi:hypothetical protein